MADPPPPRSLGSLAWELARRAGAVATNKVAATPWLRPLVVPAQRLIRAAYWHSLAFKDDPLMHKIQSSVWTMGATADPRDQEALRRAAGAKGKDVS